MAANSHQHLVFKLSQALRKEQCVDLAKFYELPPTFLDELETGGPGGKLIRALEQRLKFSKDVKVLQGFYETLIMMNIDDAAELIAKTYPSVRGTSGSAGEVTDGGSVVTSTSDAPSSSGSARGPPLSLPGEVSDRGNALMGPSGDYATKGGDRMSNPSD